KRGSVMGGSPAPDFQAESDKIKPAVDVQQLAGHKIAFWRREKQYGADQIGFDLRSLDASLLGAYFLIRRIDLSPFRDHETGAHRVDADIVVAQLTRHGPSHSDQSAFRSHVVNVVWIAGQCDVRRNVDNLSLLLLLHIRDDGLGAKPRATYVNGHRFVELFNRHFPERPLPDRHEIGGVIDQNIDSTEAFRGLIHHRFDALFIRYVTFRSDRSAAHVLNRVDHLICAGDIRQ